MNKNKNIRCACIIPARYDSSRFPGKPLALIGSKTMIKRVWEQAMTAGGTVYVATDDIRIADEVKSFGGKFIMTSPTHRSGTDRCEEAVTRIEESSGEKVDVVINIQGDEPFVRREQIAMLIDSFDDPAVQIATLLRKVRPDENITDPNHPKAVIDLHGNAIYFSRSPIPFLRGAGVSQWTAMHTYFKHIGMYGFRRHILRQVTSLPQSSLENAEALEQNRWIENGFRIRTAITPWESIGIDTPEDLERANALISEKK